MNLAAKSSFAALALILALTSTSCTTRAASRATVAEASAASAAPAATAATTTKVVTLTEEQINSSYVITTPKSTTITDRHVDLQPGKLVLTATFNSTDTGKSYALSTTLTPTLTNGQVLWQVSSASVGRVPASDAKLAELNTLIADSWARYYKTTYGPGVITAFDVSDTAITYTLTLPDTLPARTLPRVPRS